MIRLDAATVLLQWSVGGLAFLWFTTRRRQVGIGYGWLLRGIYLLMAAAAGARLKTFKYVYELDPHVDVVAAAANTTIMHAAVTQNGRSQPEVCEVIQFLADHGAALDELDAAGRTPIVAADSLPVDQAVDLLTKLITDRGGKPKIPSKR